MSTANVLSLNIDTDTVGLAEIIQDLASGPDRMSVKYLLNMDSGKGSTEERTEEEYIVMMVSDVLQGSPESEDVEEESDDIPLPTVREQMRALAIVKRILDQQEDLRAAALPSLSRLQRNLKLTEV